MYLFTSHSYEWIVEADIEACFDRLSHVAIADGVRARIADKRVLSLVRAFLKAGIMSEHGGMVWAERPIVFHARDAFPPGGVIEAPATGAAAAAFGGYLRSLALVDVPARVTILQGAEMGRPSRLLVDLTAGEDRVSVTGTASPIPPRRT